MNRKEYKEWVKKFKEPQKPYWKHRLTIIRITIEEWWFFRKYRNITVCCMRCEKTIHIDGNGIFHCPKCGWLGTVDFK